MIRTKFEKTSFRRNHSPASENNSLPDDGDSDSFGVSRVPGVDGVGGVMPPPGMKGAKLPAGGSERDGRLDNFLSTWRLCCCSRGRGMKADHALPSWRDESVVLLSVESLAMTLSESSNKPSCGVTGGILSGGMGLEKVVDHLLESR